MKVSRSWIKSIRVITNQPGIIFLNTKKYNGNLMEKKQDEYISSCILSLTSMLRINNLHITIYNIRNYNIGAISNMKKLVQLSAEYTQPSKVYRYSEELFAALCILNYEDLPEYPEVNLLKTGEHKWSQEFAKSADSAKSWAQYHLHEICIQPLIVKDANSLSDCNWT